MSKFTLKRYEKIKNRLTIITGEYPSIEACIADAMRKTTDFRYVNFNNIDFVKVYQIMGKKQCLPLINSIEFCDYDFSYSTFRNCMFTKLIINDCQFNFCDMRGCSFYGASLLDCKFVHADIQDNLFSNTCIENVDLSNAEYIITNMLQMNLEDISDQVNLALMRYDCSLLADGSRRFAEWAKNRGAISKCPFNDQSAKQIFVFSPNHDIWKPGKLMPLHKLWGLICKELNIKITKNIAG